MPSKNDWTRPQVLAALHLYFLLPFGKLDRNTPQVKQLGTWLGRTASAVALKLVNLASLDPAVTTTGRVGMRKSSELDKQLWRELAANWDKTALDAAAHYSKLAVQNATSATANLVNSDNSHDLADPIDALIPPGKTRAAVVQVRVNQAHFRQSVLARYNGTCCVSGLQNDKLLIASHIVPWSEDKTNRLNPQNGLCLSALHDRAYDQGLISVTPDFKIHVSPKIKALKGDTFIQDSLMRFDQKPLVLPERFRPGADFLARHAARFGYL
jgi:predicted restriction endonuclease